MSKCDCEKNGKLSPAVLQINNHDCPTVFHKVTFPAAMGDDETNPPRNGQYRNVLLVYEANGHAYMFSSDGIPTKITGEGGSGTTDYDALINKPSIEGHELVGDSSLEDIGVTDAIEDALEDYTPTSEFAEVAFTGDYDDLIGTPTIPVVNDATLTITRNGTSAGTFTANSANNTTIDISVPTATSDLTNDSGFITNTVNNLVNYYTKTETDSAIGTETANRENADQGLQEQIDALASASDVVDVVGTYADLQNYDTSHLNNNDIIKVLTDETHDDAISYYRWNTATSTFSYIGSQGPFYTKSESDATFVPQTRTVNNKALSSDITLTASDVGALPDSTVIPTVNNATLTIQKEGSSIGTFTANSATNATVNIVETDPTVPSWAKQPTKPTYSYSEITNKPTIPTKTSDLTNDGSDGTSTYVEGDDLATVATSGSYNDLSNKPTIPAAQVNSDWDAASGVAQILNKPSLATVATTGSYNDLSNKPTIPAAQVNSDWNANSGVAEILNKPTIPTVNNATLTIAQNGTSVGTFTANASSDTTISLTDTTYSDFSGATSSAAGAHGLVPAPSAGDQGKVLKGDGTWGDKSEKFVIMKYGESNAWAKFIAAYNENAIVYCRASSNANPATGSQTRLAFMAYVSNETNPTNVEFQYVRSVGSKTSSQPVDQVYVYKLTNAKGGTWTVETRNMGPKLAQGTNTTVSYSNGTYTISSTGGGGGPTVVQTTGQSTTDVMSQKAVTDELALKADASSLAAVATSGSYSDLNDKPTIPTVNDATLTIKQKDSTLGTFTANASSAETINITAPYCNGLYGQAQTAAFHRSVIALCEVTTTAQSSKNSWFCGRIAFHRDNGLAGVEVVNINMESQYYKAYYTNVSYYSNFTVLSSTASKDTAIGWRPCTFKYNNVYYGGIEICTNMANHNVIWYETIGNFTPFGVDYYSMPHDSTASSVLNSEINNSISFTQWDATYNQWYMGQAKRDVIYNNGSGTNANFSTTTAMSNYDEVEISYRDGNQNYALKRIPGAAGSFVLDIAHPGANNTVYWYISRYIVSGTNVTVGANNTRKAIGASSITTTATQDIYITRITGIKY